MATIKLEVILISLHIEPKINTNRTVSKMLNSTLWNLLKGETCSVLGFNSDLDENYRTRLTELGFLPEAIVTCMVAPKFGAPKVYRVNDSIYSLDDDITKFVDVKKNK